MLLYTVFVPIYYIVAASMEQLLFFLLTIKSAYSKLPHFPPTGIVKIYTLFNLILKMSGHFLYDTDLALSFSTAS